MTEERAAAPRATTPRPWRDGCGGALTLLEDLFSDAELAPLAGHCPVTERFLPHDEGFVSTRWPGSIDAALATMAARALIPTHPMLADALREVRACGGDTDRLRELFKRYDKAFMERLTTATPGAVMTNAHWIPRAFVLVHLGAASGIPAYHVHRRYPTPAAESSAALLRVAIEECDLPRSAIVDAITRWAPTEHHARHVHSTDDRPVAAVVWPDLAIVVDGSVSDGSVSEDALLHSIAADVAASREPTGEAIVAQALERLNRELPDALGIGVVLLSGTKAFGAIQGTVRCYPHPGPRLSDSGSATHFTADVTTVLLSTAPLAPEDDPSTFPDPGELHAAFERVSLRSLVSKMVDSLKPMAPAALSGAERFAARFSASPTPVALAALRAGWALKPRLGPDPADLTHRCARLVEIAEQRVEGFGLSVVVRETDGGEDGLFESVPSLQVVVVRDDIDGAADETAAAQRLNKELADGAFDALRPFTVHGEYCK